MLQIAHGLFVTLDTKTLQSKYSSETLRKQNCDDKREKTSVAMAIKEYERECVREIQTEALRGCRGTLMRVHWTTGTPAPPGLSPFYLYKFAGFSSGWIYDYGNNDCLYPVVFCSYVHTWAHF